MQELLAHRQWLGYLQPVGLVVSPPALVQAGAFVDVNVATEQGRLLELVGEVHVVGQKEATPAVHDLPGLLTDPVLFGWQASDLVPAGDPRAAELAVYLESYSETLRPTHAVPDPDGGWLMLVQEVAPGCDLDAVGPMDARHWHASPQDRFVRLMRGTKVPIGLLFNRTELRLVYAPNGHESVGFVTFPVAAMLDVPGRPILAALRMLLHADRLFTLPDAQRLPRLLSESRKYQNTVSTELAQQVLAALFELLRGFQAADDARKGELLRDVLAHEPDAVYAGLVNVLMRLVFLLYAEDRGLLSDDEIYTRNYSVGGLFERLREDAGRYPDTMDQRYGAWGQLLALFRLVHDGGGHGAFRLPPRHGYLFDSDRYPFLEGRPRGHRRDKNQRFALPLVSDGVVFRALNNLLMLEGERISYRTLDVEQIGSVYEAIMGYRLETASGRSIALKPKKQHGAPVTIDLDALLAVKPTERGKWLKEQADQSIDGKALTALKEADSIEGLVAALERRVARALTPNIVAPGGMILQPSDERRRSGSHYTPRTLTGPIVRKALEPVLQQLGDNPTPEQILSLKVCDPAMGSGAFLVEACRQLAEVLLAAWTKHGSMPKVPDDETPEILALRTIAPRCLYGVDKNPMAVGLAKLSLWLATLARNHPFTFLDHVLKCGDSLVGLTFNQIRRFHWKEGVTQLLTRQNELVRRIDTATHYRHLILDSDDFTPHANKEQNLTLADETTNLVRLVGNLAVAAFFAGDNDKRRENVRAEYLEALTVYLDSGKLDLRPTREEAALRTGEKPIEPFHWEIEFPEVFGRNVPGFDVFVGNPPFAGKNTIGEGHRAGYLDWLKAIHAESHGNADLVAHFFRRAFNLLRPGGTLGLIATNTIAQGDTRSSGLRWICTHGGTIFAARRRTKWPGQAAVVVSVVHLAKASGGRPPVHPPFDLDGRPVDRITAYLFHAGGHDDPAPLRANAGKSFTGAKIYGGGFTFDDRDATGVANPLQLMHDLIRKNTRNAERIFPYIGGEEVNDSPTQTPHRFVINFGEMSEEIARGWPDLMSILEEKVKPHRGDHFSVPFWQFERPRTEFFSCVQSLPRVLVNCVVAPNLAFAYLPVNYLCSHALNLYLSSFEGFFAVMQCRVHEIWARFFGSSMKDDLRYTPSDCFETFPFPEGVLTNNSELTTDNLELSGQAYYEFRAALMVKNNEGLTKTYNRFHDPNERSADVLRLRELHAEMDQAVLAAYGGELAALTVPPCEFLLDYEEDEDEGETPPADAGGSPRRKKKPWRYRWPDAFRDEVLALLLDLNRERAELERLTVPAEKPKKGRSRKKPTAGQGEMFADDAG